MDREVLDVEVARGVAIVTMNRPSARNALDANLRRALREAMVRLGQDGSVAVVVITGADPAFCAGLDLKEIERGEHDLVASFGTTPDRVPGAAGGGERPGRSGLWAPLTKPLIGAVNGAAITGGLELALQCDFLVASERALFADTHARVGIQPAWGLTVLLPQAVGVRRAREMSASGNFVDARTALAWGLVNHVVPHEDLMSTALDLAADIASNDGDGVRRIFQTYADGSELTAGDARTLELDVAARWLRDRSADLTGFEQRRRQVVERGRRQAT